MTDTYGRLPVFARLFQEDEDLGTDTEEFVHFFLSLWVHIVIGLYKANVLVGRFSAQKKQPTKGAHGVVNTEGASGPWSVAWISSAR